MSRPNDFFQFSSLTREEVEMDLVPGTEVMADLQGGEHHARLGRDKSVILIPQPTDDIHDPLV